MTESPTAARVERAAPGRRLIAAGFIRRATGRTLTFDATGSRVTGSIRRTGAGR
ncbi:hypothetical protein ACWGA9_24715 [Streptomyces sp. NPDC054950]